MKKITVMMAALMLAGCASAPKPEVKHSYTQVAKRVQAAPVVQAAPETKMAKFKRRWLSKFFEDRAK